jgi:hypothetical protein
LLEIPFASSFHYTNGDSAIKELGVMKNGSWRFSGGNGVGVQRRQNSKNDEGQLRYRLAVKSPP